MVEPFVSPPLAGIAVSPAFRAIRWIARRS